MEPEILALMILLIGVVGIMVMVIYLRKFKNIERMAMIEKGVSPDLFFTKQRDTSVSLRFALLLIGVGLGIMLGYFLDRATGMDEAGYFSMLFIFGGIGLGTAYVIEEKKNKQL